MAKKNKGRDYRALKKFLNKYHSFSFPMPRKGKDFTAGQKAAISRKFKEIEKNINLTAREKQTFIPYPKDSKLPHIEGVRTNKGIFYKYPLASLVKAKTKDKRGRSRSIYALKIESRQIKELFIPFPATIAFDIDAIQKFVNKQAEKMKPDYIMWSRHGLQGRNLYDIDAFNLYLSNMQETKLDKKMNAAVQALDLYHTDNKKVSKQRMKYIKSLPEDEKRAVFAMGRLPEYNGVFFGWMK